MRASHRLVELDRMLEKSDHEICDLRVLTAKVTRKM